MKNSNTFDNLQQIKKRSVSGAFSYFFRTAILQGIGFVSLAALSSLFAPEDFGIYGFVVMIIGLLTFFSDIGLAAALVQKKTEPTREEYQTAFTIQQLLGWAIVVVALGLVYSGIVANKTGWAGNWILLSLAISFPLTTLKTIPSVQLERKLEFSKLVIPQIAEQILFHGVLIYLAINRFGVISYAYAILARTIIGIILMNYIQHWEFGIRITRSAVRTLLSYGVKFQLNDLLARIKDQLFYIVVGFMLPLREFGYIQWSKNWSMYPYTLTVQNVMAITFPTFSRLQQRREALTKGLELSLFWITLAIFPLINGMATFIMPLLTVFSENYGKWMPAALSFSLFSLSIGWSAISTPLTNMLNATGKINQTLKLMLMWTGLTWFLTPPLVLWLGFNGVAVAAILISFSSIAAVFMVQKEITINIWSQVWPQLIAATAMALFAILGRHIWEQSVTSLLIGMVLSLGTYMLVLFLLAKEQIIQNTKYLRHLKE